MKKRSETNKKKKKKEKKEEKKKEEEEEEEEKKGTLRRTASTETVETMNASATRGGGGEGAGRSGEEDMETVKNEESMRDFEKSQRETLRKDMECEATRKTRVKARGREVRTIAADEKYEADWTDKKQYFPIDLRLMAEELSLNDDEKEKESDVNENKEEKRSIAQTLEDMRTSRGEKLVAWQLPPDLPLANKRNGSNRNSTARRNNNTNRRGAKRMVAERGGVDNATNNFDRSKKRKKLLEVPDLRAGQLGEIQVYADGTAKLVIGECRFDLENGVSYRHHEQFVVIDEKKKKCAFIGDIVGRVVATPDVDQLIEQSLKDDSGDDDDDDDDDDSEVDIAIRNGYSD